MDGDAGHDCTVENPNTLGVCISFDAIIFRTPSQIRPDLRQLPHLLALQRDLAGRRCWARRGQLKDVLNRSGKSMPHQQEVEFLGDWEAGIGTGGRVEEPSPGISRARREANPEARPGSVCAIEERKLCPVKDNIGVLLTVQRAYPLTPDEAIAARPWYESSAHDGRGSEEPPPILLPNLGDDYPTVKSRSAFANCGITPLS